MGGCGCGWRELEKKKMCSWVIVSKRERERKERERERECLKGAGSQKATVEKINLDGGKQIGFFSLRGNFNQFSLEVNLTELK